jgi:hypothetical protein
MSLRSYDQDGEASQHELQSQGSDDGHGGLTRCQVMRLRTLFAIAGTPPTVKSRGIRRDEKAKSRILIAC